MLSASTDSVKSKFNEEIVASVFDPWKGVNMSISPVNWNHDKLYM